MLFGHHFAAIAGAGPLVGQSLQRRWVICQARSGYWSVWYWRVRYRDFLVLFIDGRSLGEMAKQELGTFAGIIVMLGALGVMIIILAVLALVVVKALTNSPWGVFSMPLRFRSPSSWGSTCDYPSGKIAEVSIIGFVLMMLGIIYGENVAQHPYWGQLFTLTGTELTWALIIYGFIASVLPVWLYLLHVTIYRPS